MKDRFEGEIGRAKLIKCISMSKLAQGDSDLANAICEAGELRELAIGEVLIEEGESDAELYLIVSGSLEVLVKGQQVATRSVSEMIGEISLINPSQPRSALIKAKTKSLVLALSAVGFDEIATNHPGIWKNLASDLGRRLVERNELVAGKNLRPNLFIISTAEALDIAQNIQLGLQHDDFNVAVWTDGIFQVSQYALEALEGALAEADFAAAIVHPDDEAKTRGQTVHIPRDNVLFELGFFMGKLGKNRTLIIEPRDKPAKRASDLVGLTPIQYTLSTPPNLARDLGPVCTQIRTVVNELGPRGE